jgi:hypothetical protein
VDSLSKLKVPPNGIIRNKKTYISINEMKIKFTQKKERKKKHKQTTTKKLSDINFLYTDN